jgi:hypothetical protein
MAQSNKATGRSLFCKAPKGASLRKQRPQEKEPQWGKPGLEALGVSILGVQAAEITLPLWEGMGIFQFAGSRLDWGWLKARHT